MFNFLNNLLNILMIYLFIYLLGANQKEHRLTYIFWWYLNSYYSMILIRCYNLVSLKLFLWQRGNIPDCKWLPGRSLHRGHFGGSHASQMTFFCGHLPICDVSNGEENLRMAIRVSTLDWPHYGLLHIMLSRVFYQFFEAGLEGAGESIRYFIWVRF